MESNNEWYYLFSDYLTLIFSSAGERVETLYSSPTDTIVEFENGWTRTTQIVNLVEIFSNNETNAWSNTEIGKDGVIYYYFILRIRKPEKKEDVEQLNV